MYFLSLRALINNILDLDKSLLICYFKIYNNLFTTYIPLCLRTTYPLTDYICAKL